MTAARRRDLHVAGNPGRWADHALRLGEFVAQWSRTAAAHGRRLALDVRRACHPLSGDVFSVGCASTTPACAKPTNAAMVRMVRRKRQFLTHLHVRQRPEAQYVPAAYRRRERPGI